MTCEAVECAVSKGAQTIGVNAEDASRSDISFLIKYALEAKNAAHIVSDTATHLVTKTPKQLTTEFTQLQKKLKCR